jgi:hypothetical protein
MSDLRSSSQRIYNDRNRGLEVHLSLHHDGESWNHHSTSNSILRSIGTKEFNSLYGHKFLDCLKESLSENYPDAQDVKINFLSKSQQSALDKPGVYIEIKPDLKEADVKTSNKNSRIIAERTVQGPADYTFNPTKLVKTTANIAILRIKGIEFMIKGSINYYGSLPVSKEENEIKFLSDGGMERSSLITGEMMEVVTETVKYSIPEDKYWRFRMISSEEDVLISFNVIASANGHLSCAFSSGGTIRNEIINIERLSLNETVGTASITVSVLKGVSIRWDDIQIDP